MAAVITKFNDDDSLDFAMFETNLEAQLAGVHGIVLGGTLVEIMTLTEADKRSLTTTTRNTMNITRIKYRLVII